MRPSWKGHLKLSLVSVPVQAYNTQESGGGEIHFNQLHVTCHSRIRYQKVCPLHGEVPNSEIVLGYEYAKGQYTIVDPGELEQVRNENDKAITIDQFVAPGQVDSIYLDGRGYYLVPELPEGGKSYAVLCAAMAERKREGIARVVFSGREQLALIRPIEGLLAMLLLNYEHQVRNPELFNHDVPTAGYSKKELEMAEMLIDASTARHFDLSKYEDVYTTRLTELIEAKVAGREVVVPPEEVEVPVINLMDALKQSLGRKKPGAAPRRSRRENLPAPSRRKVKRSKRA